jgi:oligoribonuclease NrnB/cAMP/cGMP phosphodiesterase (DHH superfamily)
MPLFLNYVRDRDLWNWDIAETYAVHEAMGAIGRTFQLFDKLAAMSKQELLDYLLPIGEPLAAPKQKLVREVANRFTWSNVAGYTVPLVQLQEHEERLASEVCTVLYKLFPQAPFTACVRADGVSYELRSDKNGNNTSVRAIAETLGGGGHRNSAGYRIFK